MTSQTIIGPVTASILSGMLIMVAPLAAQAQGPNMGANMGPREVLLGTSTTPRQASPAAEREAQAYYDAAERELQVGRADVAQRQLEQLVARFPNTSIANVARHDLVAIYARSQGATIEAPAPARQAALTETPRSQLGAPTQAESAQGPDVPFMTGSIDGAASGWRTTTKAAKASTDKRTTRTAQDVFRQSAGDLVFFSDGSADLGARARRVLEAQADWLKAHPSARVTIEGHADDTGSAAENQKLSEARAKAVVDRLVEAGIGASRLTITAAGSSRRVAECTDQACAAQNRRVATVVAVQSVASAQPAASNARPGTDARLPWAPLTSPR
jgi:outer membrane protein OmpA-like peptidoglycan-associated protein